MRVTAIPAQAHQKRLDISVQRAEKRGLQATITPVRGLIRPASGISSTTATAWDGKSLTSGQTKATFLSNGTPTWGMSVIEVSSGLPLQGRPSEACWGNQCRPQGRQF